MSQQKCQLLVLPPRAVSYLALIYFCKSKRTKGGQQGVIKRCLLSWLTKRAPSYMSPNAGGGGLRGLSQ